MVSYGYIWLSSLIPTFGIDEKRRRTLCELLIANIAESG